MKEKDRMPFGKHKGKLYEELPDEYAAWLLHDDILIPPLREKLEEAIWKKLQKNCAWDSAHKKELLKDWVDYYYKSRASQGRAYYDGPDPSDMGYDSPYDEWDGYGNLCVDFGI